MAKLSAFPKCYMDELCVTKTMTLFEWIDLAASLGVDGVEMYPGFFENFEPEYLERVKNHLQDRGLEAPMMCASPDFTIPDEAAREAEIAKEKHIIDVTAGLGGRYCRVLSGQRREEVQHDRRRRRGAADARVVRHHDRLDGNHADMVADEEVVPRRLSDIFLQRLVQEIVDRQDAVDAIGLIDHRDLQAVD